MDVLVVHDHPTVLLQFLYKLYQDQAFCDLEIVSLDGSSLWVHKLVLMASSKYIHSVCMKAPDLHKLQFGLHTDILHMLVEFCYTGQLFVSSDNSRNVQDGAILLQMSAAIETLSQQILPETSSLLPSVHKLVPCNVYTGLREQPLSHSGVSTYTDISSVRYTMADPCSNEQTIDDNGGYREVIVKLEDFTETDENQSKNVSRKVESENNVIKSHGNESTALKQSRSGLQGQSEVKSHAQNDLNIGKSSRLKTERTHAKGHIWKQICCDTTYSSDNTPSLASNKCVKIAQQKQKVNKNASEDLSTLRNKGNKLLKIKCLKTVNVAEKVNSNSKETKIFAPKLFNRSCLLCKKSYSSVAQLLYHRTYSHPLMICGYLRRIFAVKHCKKKSLSWKYLKERGNGKQSHCCRVCGIKFRKYSQLSYHHLKKHRTATKVVESWLRFCSLKLALQKLIVPFAKDRKYRHNLDLKKSKKKNYRCVECEKTFLTSKTLTAHGRRVHKTGKVTKQQHKDSRKPEEDLFVCTKCQQSLSSQQALLLHLQKAHKFSRKEANELQNFCTESITCEVQKCGFKTKSLHHMRDHVIGFHPHITYQCSDCSLTFKVLLMLKRHVYTCHTTGKMNFHCQLCDKSFRKGSMLRKHEYFKHGIHHDNIKIYRCEHPGCKYETYASTAIKIHQSKHSNEKLFSCEYCGMKLKTDKIHRKHVDKMHLGIRPFLCQVCGLSFGEKHELQSHITNRHSSERNYQCKHCAYSTAVKATFYTHLFNVHKERAEDDKRELYSCPHCPFTSILRYRYQTHVNGHTNTRNYECKICAKSFVSANTLRSHNQWVHSDKVYSCTQCDYQTKTTQKLNEHIRVQHQLQGFKPYKCPYCTFRCATGGNTRKHVKQVHKGEEVTYIRDDELLRAARDARATGHYASLFNTLSAVNFSNEVSEDERSELSENILHIAV